MSELAKGAKRVTLGKGDEGMSLKNWLTKSKGGPEVRKVELSERELDMLVHSLSALRIEEEVAAQRRFKYGEIVELRKKIHAELVLSREEG